MKMDLVTLLCHVFNLIKKFSPKIWFLKSFLVEKCLFFYIAEVFFSEMCQKYFSRLGFCGFSRKNFLHHLRALFFRACYVKKVN